MADQFDGSGNQYPFGSFYADLASRLDNLEAIVGTAAGSVPDGSITSFKLADDAISGKTNSMVEKTTTLDGNDLLPVVSGTALFKAKISSLFTTALVKLKNAAGFTAGFNFLGTANRTYTLPDKNVVLDPGWEIIEEVNLAGIATYAKTGLDAYKELKLIGAVIPSVTTAIYMQTSSDGGSTWLSTANHLAAAFGMLNLASSVGGNGTTAGYTISWTSQNSNAYLYFDLMLASFNQATRMALMGQISGVDSNSYQFGYTLCGLSPTGVSVARNAIRIYVNSGTLSGKFTLLGKRG
ncbi:hypothetical protein EVC11_053 [Rhizobium phage RHph_I20]|uniref:Uncharacterized protein n=1 Tax=Rhizobium phage RHph_I20 TaxID=2509730 RepID=A0A7S5RGT2_9CAUD|nr:hypothetical protein EVC11_053 [Rhizobium phage RHph_I20]